MWLFFYDQRVSTLINAVMEFVKIEGEFNPEKIREHAKKWDRKIFKEKIKRYIYEKIELKC
jgi:hypothetical protein